VHTCVTAPARGPRNLFLLPSPAFFPAGDLVGLVAETLEGLPVVTAFSQNKYFIATAAHKIDEHHRALFNGESLNLWLAFYCDLYGAILVLAVCIFAVVMKDILGPAAVGLAFSNTIQVRADWLQDSLTLCQQPNTLMNSIALVQDSCMLLLGFQHKPCYMCRGGNFCPGCLAVC
jgi:ABC-type multidrug transport system fused ATPase/permease subunit